MVSTHHRGTTATNPRRCADTHETVAEQFGKVQQDQPTIRPTDGRISTHMHAPHQGPTRSKRAKAALGHGTKHGPARCSVAGCGASQGDLAAEATLMGVLERRRWHHANCMAPMPVAAAVALWQAGADGAAEEASVRVALDAGRADIALGMLQATTPLVLVGTAADTRRDAAADADRICRRLSSHMALARRPRLVWNMIVAWEIGGRRFRRKETRPKATDHQGGGAPRGADGGDEDKSDDEDRQKDAREMRRAWRFLLRFRLVAFMGALAKSSTEADLKRFWETSAPQTRAHIVAIVVDHAERTLRLAERSHCQRMWAEAAAGPVGCRRRRKTGGHYTNPNLLASMRGAVASLRNVALWAAASQDAARTT